MNFLKEMAARVRVSFSNSKWQLKNRQNRDSRAGGAMGHS